jgi:hypothetical protein
LLLLLLSTHRSNRICRLLLLLLLLWVCWCAAVLLVSVVSAEAPWLQVPPVDQGLAGEHDPGHEQHAQHQYLQRQGND